MPKFKNITIKKKGGGTRKQRVKVLKSGKYKFVKNLGSRVKKYTKRSKKNNPKRRTRKLGRRKNKRRSRKFTIPLAPICGILAAPAIQAGAKAALAGDVDGVIYEAGKFVGFTGDRFDAFALGSNILPIMIGILVHKFVGGAPLNVNRMLAAANVPIVRI